MLRTSKFGLVAACMPPGYRFDISANEVARFVLGKCTWAVLALPCHIELFSQAHYRASIDAAPDLSPLFTDVFLYHWCEESQHAILDELEWIRSDASLANDAERDAAVDDLLAQVGGVDGILQGQARADAGYFLEVSGMPPDNTEAQVVHDTLLKAYRWQYIVSGALEPRFQKVLPELVSEVRAWRIQEALAPLLYAMPVTPRLASAAVH